MRPRRVALNAGGHVSESSAPTVCNPRRPFALGASAGSDEQCASRRCATASPKSRVGVVRRCGRTRALTTRSLARIGAVGADICNEAPSEGQATPPALTADSLRAMAVATSPPNMPGADTWRYACMAGWPRGHFDMWAMLLRLVERDGPWPKGIRSNCDALLLWAAWRCQATINLPALATGGRGRGRPRKRAGAPSSPRHGFARNKRSSSIGGGTPCVIFPNTTARPLAPVASGLRDPHREHGADPHAHPNLAKTSAHLRNSGGSTKQCDRRIVDWLLWRAEKLSIRFSGSRGPTQF